MYIKMLTEDEASKGLMDVKNASDEVADSMLEAKESTDKVTDAMQSAEKAFEDLSKVMKEQIAVNLEATADKLDRVGTNFQRAATTVMAFSDIYEGAGKLLVQNAELFGLNEEQAAKLNEELEKNIANFMQVSRVLMGFGDLLEMGGFFIKQMIPQLVSLQTASNATSVSMIANIRATSIAFITSPIGIAILAITAAVVILALAWKQNWGDIRDVFGRATDRIFETLQLLGLPFKDFGDILEWLNDVFGRVFWGIMSVFEEVFNEIMDIVQEVIVEMFIPAMAELTKVWEELIAPLQEVFAEFGGNKDLLVLVGKIIAYTILAPLIILVKTLQLLRAAWTGNWKPIREDMETTFKVFKPIFDWFFAAFKMYMALTNAMEENWSRAMESMKSAIKGLWDWVSNIIKYISEMFTLFVDLIKAVGELDWSRVASIASEIVSMSPAAQLASYLSTTSTTTSNDQSIGNVYIQTSSDQPQSVGDEVIQRLLQLRAV